MTEMPPALSGRLFEVLRRSGVADADPMSFILSTTAPDGWPHLALLGPAEVFAPSTDSVRLATWPQSTTASNMESPGSLVLLTFVLDSALWKLRLEVFDSQIINVGAGALKRFDLSIVSVRQDQVRYATVTNGIRYQLLDPAAVRARWNETHRALVD